MRDICFFFLACNFFFAKIYQIFQTQKYSLSTFMLLNIGIPWYLYTFLVLAAIIVIQRIIATLSYEQSIHKIYFASKIIYSR